MSLLHGHLGLGTKVLLDDGSAAETDFFIGMVLDAIELGGQVGQGVILGIADEEGQVNQVVGIGQLVQEVEIIGEVGGGVAERGQDEDALTVVEGLGSGLDWVEIDFGDGGAVDFVGLVVVEEDGGLGVCIPLDHFVEGHFHRGFGGAVAVETGDYQEAISEKHYTRMRIAAYFCISDADLLTPRHSRMTRPVTATETKKRVRVRRTRIALHGGRPALADFQLTPPFGNSMIREGIGCE
jgi:hypothetical protein